MNCYGLVSTVSDVERLEFFSAMFILFNHYYSRLDYDQFSKIYILRGVPQISLFGVSFIIVPVKHNAICLGSVA